jgi:hypothetical protein
MISDRHNPKRATFYDAIDYRYFQLDFVAFEGHDE